MLVDDAHDGRRGDLAHRARALHRLALGHDAVGRPGLGHAVVVRHQGVGHLLLQALDHVGRQRRAAHRAHLHRREVGVGEARVVDEQVRHGRHEKDGHGALLLDHAQPAVGVEAGLIDHLHAELHGRVDEGDAGEGEERAGVHPAGAGPVGIDLADHGRRWSGAPPRPWAGRSSPRCRGCRPGPRTGAAPGRASGPRRWPRPS